MKFFCYFILILLLFDFLWAISKNFIFHVLIIMPIRYLIFFNFYFFTSLKLVQSQDRFSLFIIHFHFFDDFLFRWQLLDMRDLSY
jgi:hypothetical protein